MRKVFLEVVVVVIPIQENVLVLNMEKGKFTFVYLYVFINQECGHYEKILDRLGQYIKDQGVIFSY